MADLHFSSLCWDFIPNFPLHSMDMSDTSRLDESDMSSGYLEDVLFDFSSKRRRLLPNNSFPSYWNSNSSRDFDHYHPFEDFCRFDTNIISVSGEDERIVKKSKTSGAQEEEQETNSVNNINNNNYNTNKYKDNNNNNNNNKNEKNSTPSSQSKSTSNSHHFHRGSCEEEKKVITRVVYPFALIKPGGFKGDMTLQDINERILMPPTRPLKHPVGDFACRPLVSADGPGLSGKAVVALTTIHTRGRGTITIIRTKD